MDEQSRYLAQESETVRQVYAALNRNDIAAMVKEFAPDVVWEEPSNVPGGGVYTGRAAVAAHAAQARGNWAEGRCEPEQFIAAPNARIVVFDNVHVRLKDETEWRDGDIAAVYSFRNGLVVHARVFLNRGEALAWAGVAVPTRD